MQNFGKGALRVAKNYTKGYSDTQAKVREATSNDAWGPSGTQMNEIAQMTYNQGDFVEIMEMLDKRLNDKGKNWRHVFKSLTVLDYCLHAGSENVVIYFKDNLYVIKTLKEFQYVDEEGKDQGANVRQKAKDITNLLMDDARLREERRTRAHMRDRMIRGASGEFGEDDGPYSSRNRVPPQNENFARRRGPRGKDRDEDELRKAIEESKRTLAVEQAKQAQEAEDKDLQRAIKLSEEEEEKRKKALEDANEKSLFDDSQQIVPQTTNNLLIDPTPYTVGLQPQYTVQPQFTSIQTQFTSFNPYQQQAQQEAMQAEYLRQQQMQLAYQQQEQQQRLQQEEWMRQQYQQQQQQQQLMLQQQQQSQFLLPQQTLQSQPTGFGSNNPFAPASLSSSPPPLTAQMTATPQFNLQGTYANSSAPSFGSLPSSPASSRAPSAMPTSAMRQKDNENAALANLFANRDDGMDTFGNVGTLRYGQTGLSTQQTGSHNPFARQQQVNSERPFFDI